MSIRQSIKTLSRTPMLTTNLWEIVDLGEMSTTGGFLQRLGSVAVTELSSALPFLPQSEPPITLLATSINIPHTSIETEYDDIVQIHKYTGYSRPEAITINFLETQDMTTSKYLKKWLEYYFTEEGTFQHGVNPKRIFQVKLQKYKGIIGRIAGTFTGEPLETIAVYTLKGLMFKNRDDFQLDYSSGENITISVTFSVDSIEDTLKV